jgi:outer membrane protein OmpA-like peptidoglycan-associated protein
MTSTRSVAGLVLASLAAVALQATPARAQGSDGEPPAPEEQDREFRFELDLFGGAHFFAKDHGLGRNQGDSTDLSPAHSASFGARLALNFNRWVALELEGSGSPTRTRDGQANMFVFGYRGSLLLHLVAQGPVRPFLLVGYGGLTSVVNQSDVVPGDTDGFFHAGLGFKIGFGDQVGLRIEGRVMAPGAILGKQLPIGDELGYGGPDFEVLGGLYLAFGEVRTVVKKEVTIITPADPDGDGIAGAADHCPDVAEDKDGFQDEDGCPDPDNDRDGIPDLRDRCPDVAEDKDGFQDEDGCPDPDNDADGIPDAKDKCPNEAEDKDGFQDEDGCPDLDNDNDGIPDNKDKCPNEPETRNNYQDDDGCPDEVPPEVKKFTGVIEGIFYKTGSAEILPGSYVVLDRAVKVLQEFPAVNLEISGHTDNRGTATYNRNLSQRRADAVRTYFLARGISPARLISIGYGMSRPIAGNQTAAGRARNRRTEFRLINPGER